MALAACNNDEVMEVNHGQGIQFRVAAENATRAEATTTNSIDEFTVWAFTSDNKTLMDGVDVTKSTGNVWTYEGTQFWPEGTVDFYSVSPTENIGGTVSISSNQQKITGFTVNEDQNNQVDLLYAVNKGASAAANNSAVQVNFRHALSQIIFQAKNTNDKLKVTVKGVKIANIKKKGDFTYPSQTTTGPVSSGAITSDTQGTWSSPTEATTFSAGMNTNGVILDGKTTTAIDLTSTTGSGSAKTYTGALFMIPQTLTAWEPEDEGCNASDDVYFLLNCQILGGDDKDIQYWPKDDTEFAEVAVPANAITWEQGKKYIYTFTFGEGAGYEPGEEANPEPTLVGIKFTVTVDDFLPATGDNTITM